MTKVFKVTLMVVDHDGLDADGIKEEIERVKYPNHCMHPSVMDIEERSVDWHDSHPLNMRGSNKAAFKLLFCPFTDNNS